MRIARFSLALSALVFAAFGVWFLADPAGSAQLVGIALPVPEARIDFRATYGGLNLALGLILALAARRAREFARAGLLLQIGMFAGYAAGRLTGMAAESAAPPAMTVILAFELAGLALGVVALRKLHSASSKTY